MYIGVSIGYCTHSGFKYELKGVSKKPKLYVCMCSAPISNVSWQKSRQKLSRNSQDFSKIVLEVGAPHHGFKDKGGANKACMEKKHQSSRSHWNGHKFLKTILNNCQMFKSLVKYLPKK